MDKSKKELTVPDRLIVAADFKGNHYEVYSQVIHLAQELCGTGVYIKVESVLRASEYSLIDVIHEHGLKVVADLKLSGTPETLESDGILLCEHKPEIVTVMCSTEMRAMMDLRNELPDTEILGVTVLTSHTEEYCNRLYRCSVEEMILRLCVEAENAEIYDVITSGREIAVVKKMFPRMSVTAALIRPAWPADYMYDQNQRRVTTTTEAIKAGARHVIVGRPITEAINPRDVVHRILDEISNAL